MGSAGATIVVAGRTPDREPMRWSGITEANMRIECEVCGAQHHLADKKIPSKAFKIRCRGCGRFIIERPESAVAKTAAVAAPVATAVATRP
ncbi:MAG: zinc-ribbon domain-containing protein, partial [Myxococcales bacterium]|nr:zinc-ribbon domain-containing protein [Myxococcales bacterium]